MERLPPGKGGANPAHRPRSTPVIAYACTTSLRAQLQATLVKVASKTAGRCTPLSLPTPDGTRCPEQRSAVVVLEARVESHNSSELYLIVEGDNFVGFVQCKPDDAPKVREFAVKINNASRSIRSVLQVRDEAIAKATADLETAQMNRTGIDEATRHLEAVKGDTSRLEAARANVQAQEIERDPPNG